MEESQREDPGDAGIGVVERVAGAVDDRVPHVGHRDAVFFAEIERHQLEGVLGDAVGRVGTGRAFVEDLRLTDPAARRTGDLPLSPRQLLLGAGVGVEHPVLAAVISSLAVDGLRRGQHDLAYGQVGGDDELEEQGGADRVDLDEGAEVRHVILVGGQVEDGVHTFEGFSEGVAVPDVTADPVDFGGQVTRPTLGMDPLLQAVEDAHGIPPGQQLVHRVRADEAGAARHQHCLRHSLWPFAVVSDRANGL